MSAADQPARSLVVGTAGHIDHGKTSLVFALTGTDTDRLPEEKSRGITIDLGFASTRLARSSGQVIDLSFVDVPGHHAFIRNMLAGAAGVDCVLLVIAADEGIKPQTVEHLDLCTLLGLNAGVVALTKIDTVCPGRLAKVREEVRALLAPTLLHRASVIAVSARTGQGLDELREALLLLADKPKPATEAALRLPLDRVFSVRGFGTVVTGTLQAGTVRPGDMLELQPGARTVRIRGIQVHGRTAPSATAPTRVALNLANIDTTAIERGDTLVAPNTLRATTTVDAEITVLPGQTLPRHRARVRFHAWTSETVATVLHHAPAPAASPERTSPAQTSASAPEQTVQEEGVVSQIGSAQTEAIRSPEATHLIRLQLQTPILLLPNDRFVLRQLSPAVTVAGGRVLDVSPMPRQRKQEVRSALEQIRHLAPANQLLHRVARRKSRGLSFAELLAETGFTRAKLNHLLTLAAAEHRVALSPAAPAFPDHILSAEALLSETQTAVRLVENSSRTPPASAPTPSAGLSQAQLQSQLRLEPWVFALVWQRLTATASGPDPKLRQTGDRLTLAASGTAQTTPDPTLARVEALYRSAGLASPITSEAAATLRLAPAELGRHLTALLRQGRLVRLGADNLLVHADPLATLKHQLAAHRGEPLDVPRFKALTGLTRKHAIPLLEHLDGARITRNHNGQRTIL